MLRTVVSITPFPVPFLLLLLFIPFSSLAQDCNICGDGNYIGFPTGVVTITYNGVVLKNNCQTWSEIVKNPVAISDEYCRNELLNHTVEVSDKEMMCIVFESMSALLRWPLVLESTSAHHFEHLFVTTL